MTVLNRQQAGEWLRSQQAGGCVYLVGAGGCGMSALAHILIDRGLHVAGADLVINREVRDLRKRGADIEEGHSPGHFRQANPALVVFTSAVKADHSQLRTASEAGIPLVRRAVLLAALFNESRGIAVAGMHGKTTTAALLAHMLERMGDSPAYAIGAHVRQLHRHGRMPGQSAEAQWFVAETDESDGTLNEFKPEHAILLNIDEEHMDHFQGIEEVRGAFLEFAGATEKELIACADDEELMACLKGHSPFTTYGFKAGVDYQCIIERSAPDAPTRFKVIHSGQELGSFRLRLLGEKNVSNATAIIALLHRMGRDPSRMADAMSGFEGVDRRQQELFRDSRFRVFDDYGHHPREIRAVLQSMKQLVRGRLLVAFQPHRYTRTRHLLPEFASSFTDADCLWLAEIYAASEPAIPGIASHVLADAIRARGLHVELVPNLLHLSARVRAEMRPGDLVVFLGAGDITQVAHALAEQLRQETPGRSESLYSELKDLVSPDTLLLRNEPLARRTTLRVGGAADLYLEPSNEEELGRALRFCNRHQIPFILLGRGSNLLVRDGGVRGLVICFAHPHFSRVQVEGPLVHCGAGARLKTVAIEARKHGLTGLEFIEGIPGSVGGSMRMNAGAMGSWLFDVVETIRFMDYHGDLHERRASEVHVEYRGCPLLKNHIALGAVMRGQPASAEQVRQRMDGFARKRWGTQPRQPSAGCIFKNPDTISAGKLIDELGLKGTRVGGAMVSDVHGNFIVNDGSASAGDVLNLIELVRERVRTQRGIELETEVEVLGEG